MSPKSKKSKRKERKTRNDAKEKSQKFIEETKQVTKRNELLPSNYFNTEEIDEIKNILKIKDLSRVPFIMKAAIVDRKDLLQIFLNQGCNINETGPNHTTALIWAVKHKNLPVIEFLINHGADPTIKCDNGDHILLVALESKLWNEDAFISLWRTVKNISFIDVDYKSKSGHSMLHMAIRREWKYFIDVLINEKANIDITNNNGITPLMLACFRNNEFIVRRILNLGSNVMKEDDQGCIALCYAISSAILRNKKPPFIVIDLLREQLEYIGVKLNDFLKKYVDMINNPLKLDKTGQPTSDMIVHIIAFTVCHIKNGLQILLELNIFNEIHIALSKFCDNTKILLTTLAILNELFSYAEYHITFSYAAEKTMIKHFFLSGTAKDCLRILKLFEPTGNQQIISGVLFPIISACPNHSLGEEWLQNNYLDVSLYYEQFLEMSTISALHRNENHIKTVMNRLKRFKEYMKRFKNFVLSTSDITQNVGIDTENFDGTKLDVKSNSKKTKRRSKALKAKIAKIKSADLTERLNLIGKKYNPNKSNTSLQVQDVKAQAINTEKENINFGTQLEENYQYLKYLANNEETDIVDTIKNMLRNLQNGYETQNMSDISEIRHHRNYISSKIINKCTNSYKFEHDSKINKQEIENTTLELTLNYFSVLLKKIISEYHNNWKHDKEYGFYLSGRGQGDSTIKQNDTSECLKSNLENVEKKFVENLEVEFEKLIVCIKERAQKDPVICHLSVNKLERLLLSHEIRGKTIMLENDIEQPSVSDCQVRKSHDSFLNVYDNKQSLDNIQFNIEDISENVYFTTTYDEETPDMLYYREVSALPHKGPTDKEKEADSYDKTMLNAYHLVSSIMSICESTEDSDFEDVPCDDNNYDISIMHLCSSTNMITPKPKSEYSTIILKALTKHVEENAITGNIISRWSDLICSFQNLVNCQILFGGDLRISCPEKRHSYVISTGGNFNPVELGLDVNNRPLAVKRIPKECSACKTLKALLNPLMGVRNAHILHYFLCDYEGNDLILATPLCEYNIGQYVMLLKQTTYVHLTADDVVRQFLSGIFYLHSQNEPIIHGNLKPSNIFVDLNGNVRLAEFGIYKALFKLNEAPDSSVIWFAPETYKLFKKNFVMECTSKSDIQVSGMLIHFILTGGKHPFGEETKDILKNLEKATPQLITHDVNLQDLITWMLLYEPSERPSIKQVLKHVYFWSIDRKWRFILSCAGITAHGSSLPIELTKLHHTIDQTAIKENIKGSWVKIVKRKYPNYSCINDDDTPTGLLRFIKACLEKQSCLDVSNDELSGYILTSFPAFPLSLYRILETTSWLTHPILAPFTTIENIFS